MSLSETAKRHGLDTEKYMTYLLEHSPNKETLAKKEVLESYLPWDKKIKRACK
ncbi:TPA: transposase domain-containing protein [Streptococcus suis]|nr:transposase domain-containing protein [Streptococcus suis]